MTERDALARGERVRRGAEKRYVVVAAVEREQILAAHAPLDDGHVELRAEQHPLNRLRIVDVAVNLRLRPRRAEALHKRRHNWDLVLLKLVKSYPRALTSCQRPISENYQNSRAQFLP